MLQKLNIQQYNFLLTTSNCGDLLEDNFLYTTGYLPLEIDFQIA